MLRYSEFSKLKLATKTNKNLTISKLTKVKEALKEENTSGRR
jgi:hypothetical protein